MNNLNKLRPILSDET